MQKYLLAGLLLTTSSIWAEDPPTRNPVVLAKVGELDQALMDRLKQWVESELALPLPIAESLTVESTSLDAVATEAARQLSPEDVGMVVLNNLADASEPNGIYRPAERVVVINVTDMREGADDEKFARRLERQVIRGVCVLLGLTWSPNPQSAMASYSTLEELDQIGRNLDPPWLLKLQEAARSQGLSLDPDNLNNLIRE